MLLQIVTANGFQMAEADSFSEVLVVAAVQDSVLQDYETQHFGFTPKSFLDGVWNAFIGYLCDSMDVLKQYLAKECYDCFAEGDEDRMVKDLLPIFISKINAIFDKLEAYLTQNIFFIPSNVLLPEDAMHRDRALSVENVTLLETEIEAFKETIVAEWKYNVLLKQQRARMALAIERIAPAVDIMRATNEALLRIGTNRDKVTCKGKVAGVELYSTLVDKTKRAYELLDEMTAPSAAHGFNL